MSSSAKKYLTLLPDGVLTGATTIFPGKNQLPILFSPSRPQTGNKQLLKDSYIITFSDITEKLEANRMIADTTIMLETAIEQSPIPMALLSAKEMAYIVVNSAAKEFLGLPADTKFHGNKIEDIGHLWDSVHPDGREIPFNELPLVKAAHGIETQNQILGVKAGNKVRWAIFSASPIYNAAREVIAVFLVYIDITESREIEERLRNSETRYRMLAENVSDVIWTSDLEGKFTYLSHAIEKLSGFTAEELSGKSLFDRLTPDSARSIAKSWKENFAEFASSGKFTRYSGELEQYCKNGSTIWVQTNADGLYNENKKLVGIIGVTRNIQEQRNSHLELTLQKSTMESIITNMAQGVYIVSPDLLLLSFNKQFTELLEIPYESVTRGMSLEALFLPWITKHNFPKKEADQLRANHANNGNITFEISFTAQDGTKRWLKTFHNPLPGGGYVRTVADISGQKEIEEKLYQSEALYRSILAASPDPILILTLEGDISFISPAGCKLFCFEDTDMLDQPFLEFIAEEDRDQVMVHLEILMIQGTAGSMECRGISGNNTILSLEANAEAIINSHGDVHGIAVALRDITERKRFEQILIANEERLNRIMDLMPFPIMLTTIRDSIILYLNQNAVDTFRVQQDSISGSSSIGFYADLDEHEKLIKDLTASGYVRDREILFKRDDGDMFWARLSSLKTEIGDDTVIISGLVDITAQKETAISLIKAKEEADRANRAKSEFLANMSHEIRTPMNAILGFAELLKRRKLDAIATDYLDGIERGGRSLLSLINDILDLSKIEAGKLDIQYYPADIENVCKDLWKIFEYQARQKNIEFRPTFFAEKSSVLLIDEVRLRQIILNLLGNAIKFTAKGYVACEVTINESPSGRDSCSLRIKVKDTGIGIQHSERERIFKAFHQQEGQSARKYGGTGLGLTITRRLTKLMKGVISFESTPGEGTEFTVLFNVLKHAEIEKAEVENELLNENILFKNPKILVVEDNESNRKVVHGYLEEHNVQIYESTNGEEGCLLAETLLPDLILMDLQMPVMDGYQAIKLLRSKEKTKHIPIIIVTASVMQGEKVKVKALAEGYLHKPLLKRTLLGELMKYLPYSYSDKETPVEEKQVSAEPPSSAAIDQETISLLKQNYLPVLRELANAMVINEIQETASQLQNLPGLSPEAELCRLSTELFKTAETFDAAQIETALRKLTDYISSL
jgi:PAS domain S-box-containing protein